MTRFVPCSAALLALAAPAAAATADVSLAWGDALASALQAAGSVLVPLAVTALTAALARIAGPLRVLITASLVERLVRNVADYAVNAVAGAARGRTLTVPVGSLVIAGAVQRGLDAAPGWLVRAAGGIDGLGEKVFRSLPLAEEATVANTLTPALRAAWAERARHRP
ncbi:hypothetical protein ASF49_04455 [Methylobacterium sp. Leaf104]|uniref:hypothetical protein n=1 Tax=Methylobacterium TaxID=407 RepID=UPI0006FFDD13|nr:MULTISPECIES: hypothetical protein [Methylobacterium]KQP38592.1 hypothetical protein ASF49_04455 [Methylobacterium sp. Leaf104]MCI9880341.1 hypothetical protein [Methylobacterium goesingense]